MRGAPDLALSPGDYRIAPSEKMREEYGVPIGDVLSGDFDFISEAASEDTFHKYTVIRGDDTAALEIFETHGSAEYEWLPFSVPQYVYLFARPAEEPSLAVAVDHGWYPSYSILDPQTERTLGGVAKSKRLFGDWQLQTPAGDVRATAERTNGGLFSASTHATYAVSGSGGGEIAQFERVRSEGSLADTFRSTMNVSCSPSELSPGLCLAFAFALLYEGTKSSGKTTGTGH